MVQKKQKTQRGRDKKGTGQGTEKQALDAAPLVSSTPVEFDVAISFVDDDLPHARKIADLLKGRTEVFVYANHPERTVGADGVEAFGHIYGRDAKLVVVLYRATWGQTGWTSIEKTAINSRRVNERRDDFLIVVMMDNAQPPPWLPSARIYGKWDPLGPQGVAGAIVTRLSDLGSVVRPETPADLARRLAEDEDWERNKKGQILGGSSASEVARVRAELRRNAEEAGCEYLSDDSYAYVKRGGFFACVATTATPVGRTQLVVTYWNGELWSLTNPVGHVRRREKYVIDVERPDVVGWRNSPGFMTSSKLAEHVVFWVLGRR
ncbi:MAG: hypothetical protein AB7P34_01275 [Vicinamibacterales bacterium]